MTIATRAFPCYHALPYDRASTRHLYCGGSRLTYYWRCRASFCRKGIFIPLLISDFINRFAAHAFVGRDIHPPWAPYSIDGASAHYVIAKRSSATLCVFFYNRTVGPALIRKGVYCAFAPNPGNRTVTCTLKNEVFIALSHPTLLIAL